MDWLEGERYVSLATFRKSGKEVATPVWFAESDGRLYVFTAGDSGKVKRLRNSSRSRIAACDVRGRVHGEWHDAETRIVDDPGTLERAYAALRKKYGIQMWLADVGAKITGRIDRRAVLEIEPTVTARVADSSGEDG